MTKSGAAGRTQQRLRRSRRGDSGGPGGAAASGRRRRGSPGARPAAGRGPRTAVPGPFAGHRHGPDDRRAGRRRSFTRGGVLAQDDDAVGKLEGLVDVVGHQQHRGGFGAVDVQQQVLHLDPGERVQRAERFIEEQDTGVAGEGPGQRGPLGHAAGNFAGPVLGEVREPHEVQQPGHLRLAVPGADAGGQADRDIGLQGVPRQETRFLEGEGAAGVNALDGCAVDIDAAGGGGVESGGGPEQRGFAAAGGAEDGQDLPGADLEVNVAQDGVGLSAGAEGPAQRTEGNRQGRGAGGGSGAGVQGRLRRGGGQDSSRQGHSIGPGSSTLRNEPLNRVVSPAFPWLHTLLSPVSRDGQRRPGLLGFIDPGLSRSGWSLPTKTESALFPNERGCTA